MPIKIESPAGRDALTEFVLFYDRVYQNHAARWPAPAGLQVPLLLGESPFALDRHLKPFAARDRDEIIARCVAVLDERYLRRWNDRLGHIIMFEALANAGDAVRAMLDAACGWLASEGAQAVRSGFGLLEFPYLIDEYDRLGPPNVRINPPCYHAMLKDAGFESEKGWVDYRVKVTPELIARYESALENGRQAGITIATLRSVPPAHRARDFGAVWNEAFAHHWGSTPISGDELQFLFDSAEADGALDTDIIAYLGDQPVGALAGTPEITRHVLLKPGRVLADSEKLNRLGIGVRDIARGRGVNLAMASHLYLELIRRGAKYLSYTLVYDDNWPSRRTAEKLGAKVCANYMVYRRPRLSVPSPPWGR